MTRVNSPTRRTRTLAAAAVALTFGLIFSATASANARPHLAFLKATATSDSYRIDFRLCDDTVGYVDGPRKPGRLTTSHRVVSGGQEVAFARSTEILEMPRAGCHTYFVSAIVPNVGVMAFCSGAYSISVWVRDPLGAKSNTLTVRVRCR